MYKLIIFTCIVLLLSTCSNSTSEVTQYQSTKNPSQQGEAKSISKTEPNYLLITIDTIRADRLPLHGYDKVDTPNLDAIAKHAAVFEKATAHTPITLPSHASILSGLYPPQHGVRSNGGFYAHEDLVFTQDILKEHGYHTAAFVSAFVLDSRFGLDQGFDHYDDDLVDGRRRFSQFGVKDRLAENTVNRTIEWMNQTGLGKDDSEKPFFIWTHLYDPHFNYEPPEPFRSRYANPYDGEIAYTDHHIGRLLDDLKKRNLYDNTLIVITGDHGESFGEHGEQTHSIFIYEATQWVPMIIKPPVSNPTAHRIAGLSRHVDILPTALEYLGIKNVDDDVSRYFLGKSLASNIQSGAPTNIAESYSEAYLPLEQFGWSPLFAWRDMKHKYIKGPTSELYNLESDPNEIKNLEQHKPDVAAQYRDKLNQLQAKLIPVVNVKEAKQELDEETLAGLKALGYITSTEADPEEQDADPKDMVHFYEAREKAYYLMEKERYDEAIPVLKQLIKDDPNNATAYMDLASIYAEKGRWRDSKDAYLKARKIAPHKVSSYLGLAKVYFKGLRQFEAAGKEIEAALLIDAISPTLLTLQGDFLHAQGKMKKAVEVYRKAAEVDDQNASMFVGYSSALTNLGRFKEALKMVDRAIMIDNQNGIAYYNRGVILDKLGKLEESEKSYQKAIHWAPTNLLAYENLAMILVRQDRKDHAVAVYQRGLATSPQSAKLLYLLGSHYLREKDVFNALPLLKKAVSLDPEKVGARTNLGFAFEQLNQQDDAFAQYKELTKLYPKESVGHSDALLRMARILAKQGKKKEAGKNLAQATFLGGEQITKAAAAYPELADIK